MGKNAFFIKIVNNELFFFSIDLKEPINIKYNKLYNSGIINSPKLTKYFNNEINFKYDKTQNRITLKYMILPCHPTNERIIHMKKLNKNTQKKTVNILNSNNKKLNNKLKKYYMNIINY